MICDKALGPTPIANDSIAAAVDDEEFPKLTAGRPFPFESFFLYLKQGQLFSRVGLQNSYQYHSTIPDEIIEQIADNLCIMIGDGQEYMDLSGSCTNFANTCFHLLSFSQVCAMASGACD